MGFISLLLVGFLAGLVARLLVPGRVPLGWFATLSVGVAGSLVGGFLGKLLEGKLEFSMAGIFGSVVGAVLILLTYQTATARSTTA